MGEAQDLTVRAVFVFYALVMLVIGVWAYRRSESATGYFLAGRSLSPLTAGLSAGASDMSGWLLLGVPAFAYNDGYKTLWLAGGLVLGAWVNWLVVARRLRAYSIVTDCLTIPGYLSRRFRDHSRLTGVFSAFLILVFLFLYFTSGLVVGGKLLESVFGLSYTVAVVVGLACIVSYSLIGGFAAVCWTDVFQGLLMLAALVVVPVTVMRGEFGQFHSDVRAINPELLSIWHDLRGQPLPAITIISFLAWGLGYFGMPHVLARFQACRDNKALSLARRIGVAWMTVGLLGAVFVGLVGLVYVNKGGGALEYPEEIFLFLASSIFHPVVAGILLAAILAAVMSTADSQLLVCSSAFAEDLCKGLMWRNAGSEDIVRVARLSIIVLASLALVVALQPGSSILGLVAYAWAGLGATLGPVIVISLYWRRMNRNGALAGMLVGGAVTAIWAQLSGGYFDLYEMVPGVVFAALAVVVVSLLTDGPAAGVVTQHGQFERSLSEME